MVKAPVGGDIGECESLDNKKGILTTFQAAPGKISTTADGWSADNTKAAFLGMTTHWIKVNAGKWKLRSEVVAFKGIDRKSTRLNSSHSS